MGGLRSAAWRTPCPQARPCFVGVLLSLWGVSFDWSRGRPLAPVAVAAVSGMATHCPEATAPPHQKLGAEKVVHLALAPPESQASSSCPGTDTSSRDQELRPIETQVQGGHLFLEETQVKQGIRAERRSGIGRKKNMDRAEGYKVHEGIGKEHEDIGREREGCGPY